MRLLALVTDAFGGRGGIAAFNRELLEAVAAHPGVTEVAALPRLLADPPSNVPLKVRFHADAAGSKWRYIRCLRSAAGKPYAGVICGHVNLLPAAWIAARRRRVPLLLVIHGIDAWQSHRSAAVRLAARHTRAVVSVSGLTLGRFQKWAGSPGTRAHVIPNCVDLTRFTPGPRRRDLIERYRLVGRTVLLTVGRLAGPERAKGFDEVLEAISRLTSDIPDIAYLIVGEGKDRCRLEQKARDCGVRDQVVFAGYVPEAEKADHYRLADAFVMPSRGEGFGIVYLEALACGIPVVASGVDGGREALIGGELGELVDPDRPEETAHAILRALQRDRSVPSTLSHFSRENFRLRWHSVLEQEFHLSGRTA